MSGGRILGRPGQGFGSLLKDTGWCMPAEGIDYSSVGQQLRGQGSHQVSKAIPRIYSLTLASLSPVHHLTLASTLVEVDFIF